jgi:hypothetical protein
MNRFDQRRDPTIEPTRSNGTWGQIKQDYRPIEYPANTDYGAYTIFIAIAGSGDPCSGGNINITDAATLFSWPPGNENVGTKNPKPEYINGMKTAGLNTTNNCASSYYSDSDGASCDMFVATVFRNTVDENFPCCGTNGVLQVLLGNQTSGYPYKDGFDHNNYELVVDGSKRSATTADLQSGDILILNGHVMMYVVLPDGRGVNASASCNERTADHARPIYFSDARGNYYVFRWKG